MTTISAVSASQEALFGPNAQRLEVSLLGARTAAVLRRIVAGNELDEYDEASLNSAIDAMSSTADAIDVVAGGGQLRRDTRTFGFGAMAFAVESAAVSLPPAEVPQFLRRLADDLRRLLNDPSPAGAALLVSTFSMLADVAMRQAGSVGEGNGSIL
jgi:hypothetical protein